MSMIILHLGTLIITLHAVTGLVTNSDEFIDSPKHREEN